MTPPDASIGSAIKAATFSGPSSKILSSNSFTFASQNSSSVALSSLRYGFGADIWCTISEAKSKLFLSLSFPEHDAPKYVLP